MQGDQIDPKKSKIEYQSAFEQRVRQARGGLPKQLIFQVPLNPSDFDQQFYRLGVRAGQRSEMMMKLGWRVTELAREQVDLAIYCLSLLQAELRAPFGCFTVTMPGQEERKVVWLEWHIIISGGSREEAQDQLELSVFNLCERRVLPLLRKFIEQHITWDTMCHEDYEDSKVVKIFQKQVIAHLAQLLRSFRVGRDFLS